MRDRHRISTNLESLYRSEFEAAETAERADRMSQLDFDFQRDPLLFEILLDIRDALTPSELTTEDSETLLDKAEKLRRITKLR